MNCQDIEIQISGYLDGELTQQQAQQVRVHIDSCEHCKKIYQDLKELKSQIGSLEYKDSDVEMLDKLESDLTSTVTRRGGMALLILGFCICVGFSLLMFFTASDVPFVVKLFYGLFIFGGLALFVSVLRQRMMTYKNDKYRKVKL